MKSLICLFLLWSLIAGPALGQDCPIPVSLIELIASPEKFDSKLVTVQGFLRIGHEKKHAAEAILYLHEEDAKNLLGSNSVLVLPSEQMLQDIEKIDREYVMLTGFFHVVRAVGDDLHTPGLIKDVRNCATWSDPKRPIGEQRNNQNKSK